MDRAQEEQSRPEEDSSHRPVLRHQRENDRHHGGAEQRPDGTNPRKNGKRQDRRENRSGSVISLRFRKTRRSTDWRVFANDGIRHSYWNYSAIKTLEGLIPLLFRWRTEWKSVDA